MNSIWYSYAEKQYNIKIPWNNHEIAAGLLILIFIAVNIDKYNPYKQKLFWDPPSFLKVGRVPERGKEKFKKHWSTPCVQE